MSEYRESSHAKYRLHIHLVWVTKYRNRILKGVIAKRTRALFASSGNVTDEVIKAYIEQQNLEKEDDFRITET